SVHCIISNSRDSDDMRQMLYKDFFFYNNTSTTEIYTLSLHDALPIFSLTATTNTSRGFETFENLRKSGPAQPTSPVVRCSTSKRSEEHTSELQSRGHLVCRLLLEKKNEDITLDEIAVIKDRTDAQVEQ